MVSRLVAPLLCWGLLGQVDAPGEAWVAADALTVLAEPDDAAFATGRLKRGDRVVIRREDAFGWLAIEPPEGAFSWIERDAVEMAGDDRARVVAAAAAVRPGSETARLPGGTWTVVRRGTTVRLLDRPPLVLRRPDGGRRVWYAIAPTRDEVRYVRAEGVESVDPDAIRPGRGGRPDRDWPSESGRKASLASQRVGPIDPDFAAVGPSVPQASLTPSFAAELARAQAGHRAVLVLPIESWRFDRVRQDYQNLLRMAASPEERTAAQSRLEQVGRQEAAARAAREIAAIADRSRRRDEELRSIQGRLDSYARDSESPFAARGLLQRSSKMIEGRRAYVLIGAEGHPEAYLRVPPGLEVERLVGHRVGVRGDARYDEALRRRVIWVRDAEALDEAP